MDFAVSYPKRIFTPSLIYLVSKIVTGASAVGGPRSENPGHPNTLEVDE